MSIARWPDENLARFGEYEALVTESGSWTNRELHDQASRLATALVALGIQPGDVVLIAVPYGRTSFVASMAAWRSGAVVVCVGDQHPPDFVGRVVAHCAPKALVATASIGSEHRSVPVRISSDSGADGRLGLDALLADHEPMLKPVHRDPDATAQIIYSKGTTGDAKAVALSHRGVDAFLTFLGEQAAVAEGASSVELIAVPPSVFGSIFLLKWLSRRARTIVLERFDPETVIENIERHRVTTMSLGPALMQLVLDSPRRAHADLSSLREIVLGGQPLDGGLNDRIERELGVTPTDTYGASEAGGAISWGGKNGSVGKPLPGVDVELLEPDAEGRGELLVRTPWLAQGYFRDELHTKERFQNGWWRSGDLASLDESGSIVLHGRVAPIALRMLLEEMAKTLLGTDAT